MSQLCIFVPLLTYDERRIASSRNFCICCIKHESYDYHKSIKMIEFNRIATVAATRSVSRTPSINPPMVANLGTSSTNENATEVETAAEVTLAATRTANINEHSATGWRRFVSIEYILMNGLVPILSNRIARIVIYLCFGGIFAASLSSFSSVNTETDVTKLVPDDSHIIDYLDALHDAFGEISFANVEIIIENRDFSDSQTRDDVRNMIDEFDAPFTSDYGYFIGEISQWMTEFDDWIAQTFNDSNMTADDVEDEYYQLLQEFIDSEVGIQWKDKIIFDDDDNPTKIVATNVCVDFLHFSIWLRGVFNFMWCLGCVLDCGVCINN